MKFIFKKNKEADRNAQHAGMRIILEHGGTPMFELRTDEYSKEIVIGRSRECTWCLDGVDLSSSSKHAMISRRKSNFYITDLGSRNGIFFQNKRIKERKLALGDKISLGECTIIVDVVANAPRKISQFHRLAYANEKGKRVIVDISKPRMILGSSSDCDLIFQDQLISSQHAEITLKSDGSCWLRDLGSRNGTSVNGTELLPDSERMLQDNDVITIAYLDIHFWDSAADHQDSRIGTAVIVIAVTLLVILGGYIAYGKLTPDAPKLIDIATREMQEGRFESARKILTDAVPFAENAADTQYQREQLLRRISQWEGTIKMWSSVQQDLNAGFFPRAVQKISSISSDDLNLWTWPGGATEKRKAMAVKKLLDACSATSACLKNMLSTVEELEQIRRELMLAITECRKFQDEYFSKCLAFARPFEQRIDKTLSDDKELQRTLALLNASKPDYLAIIKRLDQISKESSGPVKARADRVLPAVNTLHRETMRTLAMVDKVCDLDFKTVQAFRLDLPDGIDYSSEKNIGTLKNQLIDTVGQFKDTALQLSLIHGDLVRRGIMPGKAVPFISLFEDRAAMSKIYQVDTLDFPLPKSSRATPSGQYDAMLGVEFFYDYICNVHTHTLTINPDELPFKPTIFLLKENLREIDKFISFADKDENQWFNRGAFAEYLKYCKNILQTRNKIVQAELARNAKPGTREFLISRGISAYLLPEGKQKADLEVELERSFSTLKRKILILNRDYTLAMPEEALEIRGKIIQTGLPGDAIVKKMWQQRPATGWSGKK